MTDDLKELLSFHPNHLAWPVPDQLLTRVSESDALLWLTRRKQRIIESEQDPLAKGYIPDIWQAVDKNIAELRRLFPKGVVKILVFGGNRSSKTRKASNYVMTDLARSEGRRWWCCDSTEAMSRTNQMRLLHEQLPVEWRGVERDDVTDMRYTIADGFPKNMFVTPNKGECSFKFYSMDIGNLPGPELDGIWADELIPLEWVQTLVYRLVNRNGIFLITFTPELGWNETFGHFFEGAQMIEEQDAPLLPKHDEDGRQIGYEKMPRVMQCADPTARILFFWTQDNPFGNYESLVRELRTKSREEIRIRAYGLCSKAHTCAFPRFNETWHVRDWSWFNGVTKQFKRMIRVHLVDPCDGRNWFMIWVAIPSPKKWIIYREWPSHGHPKAYIEGVGHVGPWATSGAAADGVKGPAQQSFGFGLETYRDEILRVEQGETILARYIDSRYATSSRTDRESVTTLQEQLTDVGIDFLTMTPGKGRIIGFDKNDGSVDLINSALYFDPDTPMGEWSKELGRLNEPQLIVLDTCPNTIYALKNWTGKDGQKGACKDPIDVIRGLFLSDVDFATGDEYAFRGGGVG